MPHPVAVYTALFGGYDALQEPAVEDANCDFICFTDDGGLRSRTWRIVHVPATLEPAMMNRQVKLHPHLYLPDHEVSIYVDANLKIRHDPVELVDKYLTGSTFAAPRHPVRDCVYDEIQIAIETGKTDAATGNAQADRYRRSGYPARNGLTENRVLLRRHHDPTVKALMEAWWRELISGVKRDQASLQVICWRMGFDIQYMTEDVVFGSYFMYRPHRHAGVAMRAKVSALIAMKRLFRLSRQLYTLLPGQGPEAR